MNDLQIIKKIAEEGFRIFTVQDLKLIAASLGIQPSYLSSLITKMAKNGLIRKLYRGTYVLANSLLAGSPLHSFEVIPYLSNPSAICCWNALSFHGLTDQVIRNIYLMSPYGQTLKKTSKYLYSIEGIQYVIIRVQPRHYFGIEQRFINENAFYITDLERTLMDGLVRPQYCGGFFEVIEAFRIAYERNQIDPQKTTHYAGQYGILVSKRLGWVFETLGIFSQEKGYLKNIPYKGIYKLDISKPNVGEVIPGWNLKRNF